MGLPTIDFHFPSKYKNNVNFEFEWNMLFAFIFFNFIYFSPSNHIKVYLPTPLTINTFVLMARSDHNASKSERNCAFETLKGGNLKTYNYPNYVWKVFQSSQLSADTCCFMHPPWTMKGACHIHCMEQESLQWQHISSHRTFGIFTRELQIYKIDNTLTAIISESWFTKTDQTWTSNKLLDLPFYWGSMLALHCTTIHNYPGNFVQFFMLYQKTLYTLQNCLVWPSSSTNIS